MRKYKTTAIHEAGHAVAAVRLAVPFRTAYILGREGKVEGSFEHIDAWTIGQPAAIVLLAGPSAEMLFMKRSFEYVWFRHDRDFQQAINAAGSDMWRDALILVKKERHNIVRVSNALMQRGSLFESEVRSLIL